MFDLVHRNKRIVQVILALLILPFAFWGVESYQRLVEVSGDVASVGGQKISQQEFSEAVRNQQDRMRQLLGRNFDPATLDTPQIRSELLEGMISQRLLAQHAVRANLAVSDAQLREVIGSMPAFQDEGRFSSARYESLLRAEGYTPRQFEATVRRDLLMQQLAGPLAESGIASRTVARQVAMLRAQQREVAEHVIAAEPLQAQVKVAAEAVRAHYDANLARYQVPEQAAVEFVVLNNEALAAAEPLKPEEIKAFYDANASRYGEQEQRQASHILIAAKGGEAQKAEARAKAEEVLAEVRKSPAGFAELAKKHSDDPGSAGKGGDLGYFGRGMMVAPFENAAFQLKPNEVSGLVESDFGYHIIKVTGIKPGKMKGLDEVRPEIERELRMQRAGRRYAEAAETFSNLVYEQSDSLKPVADKFGLPLRRAEGITRGAAPVPQLSNPKLLAAIFSPEALKTRRNTEAVEVAPNTLVSARVVEHKPAAQRPFEEVKADIERRLVQEEAAALARKRGQERLQQLVQGGAGAVSFGTPRLVTRDKAEGMDEEALNRVFRVDPAKLPAYVGVESAKGYALYRVSRVIDSQPDEARERSVQAELGRAGGTEEFKSFLAALRADGDVQVNKTALEGKPKE